MHAESAITMFLNMLPPKVMIEVNLMQRLGKKRAEVVNLLILR